MTFVYESPVIASWCCTSASASHRGARRRNAPHAGSADAACSCCAARRNGAALRKRSLSEGRDVKKPVHHGKSMPAVRKTGHRAPVSKPTI